MSNNSGNGSNNEILATDRVTTTTTEDQSSADGIEEAISIPDRDLEPPEIAAIMKQVSRVCNFLAALIMKNSATSSNTHAAGAGHPVCQAIINCASQADGAYMTLAAMEQPRIMQPQAVPVMRRR